MLKLRLECLGAQLLNHLILVLVVDWELPPCMLGSRVGDRLEVSRDARLGDVDGLLAVDVAVHEDSEHYHTLPRVPGGAPGLSIGLHQLGRR